MKKKKLKQRIRSLESRVAYLELNCEIREPKYVTFKRYVPLPPVDNPQPSEEEKETLLEKYLRRRNANVINQATQEAISNVPFTD